MKEIKYRALDRSELSKISEINRAENIFEFYEYVEAALVIKPVHEIVTSFEEQELNNIIAKQHQLIENGGKVIGAFDHDTLVGVASVEREKRGLTQEYCNMNILYVSYDYRGYGIGHHLVQQSKQAALDFGAKKLYISATPTRSTVDFYLKEGAIIAKELNPELFKLEPLDIHLELKI